MRFLVSFSNPALVHFNPFLPYVLTIILFNSQGDSGGPLFQYDPEGSPVLVGIVSIGVECANARFPGVYVRTSAHIDFLPSTGIVRAEDAVAVFSDFVPTKVIRKETIILAATGGAVVLFAVLFLSFVAVSKWKRDAAARMEDETAEPTQPSSAYLSGSTDGSNGMRPDQMSGTDDFSASVSGVDSRSQPPHWTQDAGLDEAGMTVNAVSAAAGRQDSATQEKPGAEMQSVGSHAFENFDPYQQHAEPVEFELKDSMLQDNRSHSLVPHADALHEVDAQAQVGAQAAAQKQ